MSAGGVTPSGSSRHARLDPFALPIRFTTADTATDTRLRDVELGHERVVLRRTVSGMRMAMALPLDHFLGVTLTVVPPGDNDDGTVAIVLSHRDAALSVPLYVADDGTDAIAEWQLWAKVLGLPLLIADPDGARGRSDFDGVRVQHQAAGLRCWAEGERDRVAGADRLQPA